MENENPTILSVSQLPTRHSKSAAAAAARTGPGHAFDQLVWSKPSFAHPLSGSAWADDDDSSSFVEEPIDEQEIYDLAANIADPEHPLSLGQLAVINLPDIHISPPPSRGIPPPTQLVRVEVDVTPTVSHCSHATIIGLAVRVHLERCLPPNYRVDVRIKGGTHAQDDQVTKQLADKERVAAALENESLMAVLNTMLKNCDS